MGNPGYDPDYFLYFEKNVTSNGRWPFMLKWPS